ncbi:MAG: hypothetical protein ACKVH8_14900 [Pirellulales bacterium]|jgi:hypothetical protein
MSHGNNPFEEEHNPYSSTETNSYQPERPEGQPSGAVMGLAVVSFVLGGLNFICGGCMAILAAGLVSFLGIAAQDNPEMQGQEFQAMAMIGGGVILVLTVIYFLLCAAHVLTGFGLLKLRTWARMTAIIVGAIDGVFGVIIFGSALLQVNPASCISGLLLIGYCVYALAIMLNPKYAAEFEG